MKFLNCFCLALIALSHAVNCSFLKKIKNLRNGRINNHQHTVQAPTFSPLQRGLKSSESSEFSPLSIGLVSANERLNTNISQTSAVELPDDKQQHLVGIQSTDNKNWNNQTQANPWEKIPRGLLDVLRQPIVHYVAQYPGHTAQFTMSEHGPATSSMFQALELKQIFQINDLALFWTNLTTQKLKLSRFSLGKHLETIDVASIALGQQARIELVLDLQYYNLKLNDVPLRAVTLTQHNLNRNSNGLSVWVANPFTHQSDQTMYIMRGLPGSGKTTKANEIKNQDSANSFVLSSHDYFEISPRPGHVWENGQWTFKNQPPFELLKWKNAQIFGIQRVKYVFRPELEHFAERWNLERCTYAAHQGLKNIIIDNPMIQKRDALGYMKLAIEYSYKIVLVEPDTDWWKSRNIVKMSIKNDHGVPYFPIREMSKKWEIFTVYSMFE